MSRRLPRPDLPMRGGVTASCVALPPGAWACVADFLSQRLPKVSHDDWLARMARGEVFDADGHPLAPDAPYRAQTRVYYYRQLDHEAPLVETEQVLFADAHLVVADKPPFMPVTPKGRYVNTSLLVRLRQRLNLPELSPLHRIDRETSGLVVLAVRAQDRHAYQRLFALREVEKTYHAIAPVRDDLELPRVHRSRLASQDDFFVSHEVPGEPNSETHIALLDRVGSRGLYGLSPITGRRHQLRVHLSALGIPIEGDAFYPQVRRGAEEADDRANPLQLLAQSLRFVDPITGEVRHFESQRRLRWPDAGTPS